MYQFDALTELQLSHFRRQELDERLRMLRLIHEAGLDTPGFPNQLLATVGDAFAKVTQKLRRPAHAAQPPTPISANREKLAA
jgi:hypothetical protein